MGVKFTHELHPRRKTFAVVVFLLFGGALWLHPMEGERAEGGKPAVSWFCQKGEGAPVAVEPDADGVVSATRETPGSLMLFSERRRETFRPAKEDFLKGRLSMEVKAECSDGKPVRGWIFVNDKDGLWFQSRESFELVPGVWSKVEVGLSSWSHDLAPENHSSAWSCLGAATIFAKGFHVFSKEDRTITLSCRGLELSGERERRDFHVTGLSCPRQASVNKMLEGRFDLSREYFNPFDPSEITVDVHVVAPDSRETVVPAFFTLDYERRLCFNREMCEPKGKARWAFRHTPTTPGVHKFRIVARDSSEPPGDKLVTPYVEINVEPSDATGFVRVCQTDPRYFELSTGEFFYPIGFNIHSVKDSRSESRLMHGYRPDKGTYSYDEYFKAMAENGGQRRRDLDGGLVVRHRVDKLQPRLLRAGALQPAQRLAA